MHCEFLFLHGQYFLLQDKCTDHASQKMLLLGQLNRYIDQVVKWTSSG